MSYALNRQQFGWVPHPSPLHCRLTPHVKPKNWELWVLPLILGRYGTNNLKYSKPPRLVFCQILTSRMLKSGANWTIKYVVKNYRFKGTVGFLHHNFIII